MIRRAEGLGTNHSDRSIFDPGRVNHAGEQGTAHHFDGVILPQFRHHLFAVGLAQVLRDVDSVLHSERPHPHQPESSASLCSAMLDSTRRPAEAHVMRSARWVVSAIASWSGRW